MELFNLECKTCKEKECYISEYEISNYMEISVECPNCETSEVIYFSRDV